MGTDINFRVWDTVTRQMFPVSSIELLASGVKSVRIAGRVPRSTSYGSDTTNFLFARRIILMQYTGLHDKNGNRIYEGDIVGYFWLEKLGKYYDCVPVVFEQGQFCVYIDGLAFHKRLTLDGMLDKMVVLGNIYQNPELLAGALGKGEQS